MCHRPGYALARAYIEAVSAQRAQVRPVEEPEKVRQPLVAPRAKDRNQTFRAGQVADRGSMAGLFDAAR